MGHIKGALLLCLLLCCLSFQAVLHVQKAELGADLVQVGHIVALTTHCHILYSDLEVTKFTLASESHDMF